jgi:predicted GIY-YIG superfamily endonuclease
VSYLPGRPTALYRLLGPSGLILYIGVSCNPRARISGHKHHHRDTWWPLVQGRELVWYPNRSEALQVETVELRRWRPICNPVIPSANGKHATILPGLKPVRSLWQEAAVLADQRDETVIEFIDRAIRAELRRRARNKGREAAE